MVSDYPKAVAAGWHPVASLAELGRSPLARSLMGRSLVVFRAATGPAVFFNRCPHRNMALSRGKIRDGTIECPYHGWRFAGDGRCVLTPGAAEPATRSAETLPVVARAGLVWTCLAPEPGPFPALPWPLEDDGYDRFWWLLRPSRARLIDAIENFLDPAHPHFLHAGLVRSGSMRRPVEVTIRIGADRAEAIYVENARAAALMPRLLEGLRSVGIGRFLPPTIGQLVFEGPAGPRLVITVFFTPTAAGEVQPVAHFATPKGRAPAWLKRLLLKAFNGPVVVQDRAALALQSDTIEHFGAPKYALGPLDFLLPAIRQLAEGEVPDESERIVKVEL